MLQARSEYSHFAAIEITAYHTISDTLKPKARGPGHVPASGLAGCKRAAGGCGSGSGSGVEGVQAPLQRRFALVVSWACPGVEGGWLICATDNSC